VKSLLKSDEGTLHCLYVQQGRQDSRLRSLTELAQRLGVSIAQRRRSELDKLADGAVHQGVVLEFDGAGKPPGGEAELLELLENRPKPWLILVLDGIQDPHNLGACLRSADAAGVDAVVTTMDNSVGMTPVVRKVASGAAETVAFFQVTNLQRVLKKLQDSGVWVHGAAGEAESTVYATDWTGSVAVVMGSEGHGMRRLTRENCDTIFQIPMVGSVDSLNVSVATGIILFEAMRQRTN
jgi:23S rRNA (guanosine2251-2'-O)-methyltransferase